MSSAPSISVKELRLALVCYGGVSLAIYMHGITKEIHKLIRAARAFDSAWEDDPELRNPSSPFGGTEFDTESVYFDALVAAARNGHPLTVVLDVITGTSAGGINGVFLGRALAEGRSQDGLRDVWLQDGDLNKLLRVQSVIPFGGRIRMALSLLRSVLRLLVRPHAAPLNGTLMSRLLHSALTDMERVEDTTLVPPDNGLDLITTATDVRGYDSPVSVGTGRLAHTDRSYRQALRFRHDTSRGDPSGFDDGAVDALAFAARATSSFPGAFPAVSVAGFLENVGGADEARAKAVAGHFLFTGDDVAGPAAAWYMDGGVLDNGPFDFCIDLIAEKRAERETARELVYIEPDPHDEVQGTGAPQPEPSVAATVWAAKVTVPGHVPFVAALGELRTLNGTIAEVGSIVERTSAEVVAEVTAVTGDEPTAALSYDQVQGRAAPLRDRARERADVAYPAYCRLRAEGLARLVGVTLAGRLGYPARSNRALLVADILLSWVRHSPAWTADDKAVALENQLEIGDLPYRMRRAQFVLQGVNALFTGEASDARRKQLAAIKTSCWDLLEHLRNASATAAAAVEPQAHTLFSRTNLADAVGISPDDFADRHFTEIGAIYETYRDTAATEARGSSIDLWEVLGTATLGWSEVERAGLLGRYVGFPIWDAVIYPTIALAAIPQLSPIDVRRFSPLDADRLTATSPDGKPQPKLRGTAYAHFGGFLDKGWRQGDYLWGRLDGVELIMNLLRSHAGDIDLDRQTTEGFRTVLDTEEESLRLVRAEMGRIRRQLAGSSGA